MVCCNDLRIEADTITTAKALTSGYQPLSALLVADRIANTLVEKAGNFITAIPIPVIRSAAPSPSRILKLSKAKALSNDPE
jgi:4-aminobutyrate aminotransferase-like enzyme